MTPQFAKAVDPIFLDVLDLLDRIGREGSPRADEEQVRLLARLDRAGADLGHSKDWELARYALVAWIDEVLIEAPWAGAEWWKNNPLEIKLYNTREAFTKYYTEAKESSALPKRDALEVFYVGVVLGFRGLYRNPDEASVLTQPLGLPPDLESWARQTAMGIQVGKDRPRIVESGNVGRGAPPLRGQSLMIASVLFGVILSALTAILVVIKFFPQWIGLS